MLYLVVDPSLFILSEDDCQDVNLVNQFLANLVAWAKNKDQYDTEFGLTSECMKMLLSYRYSAFNTKWLKTLSEKVPTFDAETVTAAITPLIEILHNHSHIDDALTQLERSELAYQLGEIFITPTEYLDRLDSEDLRQHFQRMLGAIVFARQQKIVPLSDLKDIRLVTVYSDDEIQQWAKECAYKLLILVNFDWVLNENVTDYEQLNALERFFDEIGTIHRIEMLEGLAQPRQWSTVIKATEYVCNIYSKKLILTPEARQVASKSNSPNLDELYRALSGLIEVWLPIYQKDGASAANLVYHQRLGHKITGEGEQVKANPKFRTEREGTYNGEKIFAELHIKLSAGNRIYFAVYSDKDKLEKIILTRVGNHPRSANFS